MRALADYHTHTRYGAGRGSVADNARAGLARGLEIVAVADNGPAHLIGGLRDWRGLRAEVEAWNATRPSPRVLLGVEASVTALRGDLDVDPRRLGDFDLVLVGLSPLALPSSLSDAFWMWRPGTALSPRLRRRARELGTRALCAAIARFEVDVVAHPRAYGLDVDLERLGRAAARRQTAIELSSAHPLLSADEVRALRRLGVRFSLGSDAREAGRVGCCGPALRLAEAAGLGPEDLILPLQGGGGPEPK